MAIEITKAELIERERNAWKDFVRRLEFMTEIMQANSEKVLVKDASSRLIASMEKLKPILRQRAQIEFAVK